MKPISESESADKGCSRCDREAEHGEAFRCYRNTFKFDVDMARSLVANGRTRFELDDSDLEYSIDRAEINEEHVAHVDPTIPGIVAHVFFPTKDGRVVHAHRLIDGHHRAARCKQLGIPFGVFVLTERESVAILERCPDGARPAEFLNDSVK